MPNTKEKLNDIQRSEDELNVKRRKLMQKRKSIEGKEFFEGLFSLLCYKSKYNKDKVHVIEAHYYLGNFKSDKNSYFNMHKETNRFYPSECEDKLMEFFNSMDYSTFKVYLKELGDANDVEVRLYEYVNHFTDYAKKIICNFYIFPINESSEKSTNT